MKSKVDRIAQHMQKIMDLLEIPVDENTKDTPKRVARMWVNETVAHVQNKQIEDLENDFRQFPATVCRSIRQTKIEFSSLCMHHLMPFFGEAEIFIVPDKTVPGLSKIPRVVEYFSKKPQLQEYLTEEIASFIFIQLDPKFVGVRLKATHTCVMCRGVKSPSETETIFYLGDEKYLAEWVR